MRAKAVGPDMTPREVAAELKIGIDKVHALIKAGELPATNVALKRTGRPQWRVTRLDLMEFRAARAAATPPAPKPRRKREQKVIEYI